MSKQKIYSFIFHLLLFILIEVLFIVVLFREIPTVNFVSILGLFHISYWIFLLIAGWLREVYAKKVLSKGLCTYLPVVYHVFIHIYATWYAIEEHTIGDQETIIHHTTHDLTWIIIGAISIGILVFVGEYLLHRKVHCDSHHKRVHKKCHDKECEKEHNKNPKNPEK